MVTINKERFLSTLSCPTAGWLLAHTPPVKLSRYDHFLMEQELEVHKKAQALYPQGILVGGNDISAEKHTEHLIRNPNTQVLFEAVFMVYEGITRADIIKRQRVGWWLYKIKSSVNNKDEYLDDLAYTAMIALQAGLKIIGCSLLLLSPNYRLGLPVKDLFQEISLTLETFQKAKEFWLEYDRVLHILQRTTKPHPELRWECQNCLYFPACMGQGIENSIFDLPQLNHTKFCHFREQDIQTIDQIPEDFILTHTQQRIREAIKEGRPYLDRNGLTKALEQISFPLYFLDFETVSTAIPLYPDITPRARVPFQYSLHVVGGEGEILTHHEYLADPRRDCRKELVEHLIRHCDTQGTILCFNDYEKQVIQECSEIYPERSTLLEALLERLINLSTIMKQHYYHPGFHGSYSIKDVLAVLVPSMSYEDMEVSNGRDAMSVFADMATGKLDKIQEREYRNHLLKYCKLDTLAMVKIWEQLVGMVRETDLQFQSK
ncbi:MAG: DUF2779 domain-containing protein [Sedimentisphaerales bacterium]|nr:DUF2779 domain-containing protein [Sedimentisphaerales bacterium]